MQCSVAQPLAGPTQHSRVPSHPVTTKLQRTALLGPDGPLNSSRLPLCPSIHFPICPKVARSICQHICLCFILSVRLSICMSVQPFVRLSISLPGFVISSVSIGSSICLSVWPHNHWSACLLIYCASTQSQCCCDALMN